MQIANCKTRDLQIGLACVGPALLRTQSLRPLRPPRSKKFCSSPGLYVPFPARPAGPLDFETFLTAPPLQFGEYLTDRSGPPEPICNFHFAICNLLSQSVLHRILDNSRNRYLRWSR